MEEVYAMLVLCTLFVVVFRGIFNSVYSSFDSVMSRRESDGSFAFGNYMKEVEDLRAVIKYFESTNRIVSAVVGHSKGCIYL